MITLHITLDELEEILLGLDNTISEKCASEDEKQPVYDLQRKLAQQAQLQVTIKEWEKIYPGRANVVTQLHQEKNNAI